MQPVFCPEQFGWLPTWVHVFHFNAQFWSHREGLHPLCDWDKTNWKHSYTVNAKRATKHIANQVEMYTVIKDWKDSSAFVNYGSEKLFHVKDIIHLCHFLLSFFNMSQGFLWVILVYMLKLWLSLPYSKLSKGLMALKFVFCLFLCKSTWSSLKTNLVVWLKMSLKCQC